MLALAIKGQTLHRLQRYAEAAKALEHVVELNPHLEWALSDLINVYRDIYQPERALAALDRALAVQPNSLFALANTGKVLNWLAEYETAIEILDRAISLQPLTALYFLKGWALEYMNRVQEALAAYETAFRTDEKDVWSRKGLADALRHLGRVDEAEPHYRWVIDNASLAGLTPRILWVMGWCYYGLGELEHAMRFFTEVLSFDSEAVPTQFDLALVLAASKRFSLSLSEYQRGVEFSQRKIKPLNRRAFLHVAAVDLHRATQSHPEIGRASEVQQALHLLRTELETARAEAAPIWTAIRQRAADSVPSDNQHVELLVSSCVG